MAVTMKLKDLVEEVQMQNDDLALYFNLRTGGIISIGTDYLTKAEEGVTLNSFVNGDRELYALAVDIVENLDDYVALPSKYDLNDSQIMADFTETMTNKEIAVALNNAIEGVGAARRFNDLIYRYDLTDEWFGFRDQAYKNTLIEWCKEHRFNYIDDFEPMEK